MPFLIIAGVGLLPLLVAFGMGRWGWFLDEKTYFGAAIMAMFGLVLVTVIWEISTLIAWAIS